MRQRVYNPNSDAHSLDRIDNNGDYEPGNVRWATWTEQNRNRRSVKLTPDLVQEIHGRIEHGEKATSVATRVNVCEGMIRAIRVGRTWRGSL